MKKFTLMVICLLFSAMAFAQPPNDTCAGAIPIMPSPQGTGCGVATFNLPFTADGTTDSGVPTVCSNPGLDQYFTWTATTNALIFNSENPGSPGIAVFANCADVASGTDISCAGTFASNAQLSGWTIGDNLIIQVYDFNGSFSDVAFCLELFTPLPPPVNDDCANAITITDGDTLTANTDSATVDGAGCSTSANAQGVWYVYNDGGTPSDVIVSLCASDFDTEVSVFTGTCGALVCLGNNDDDFTNCGNSRSYFTFTSDGVSDYYILATGFSSNTGNLSVNLSAVAAFDPITLCDPASDTGAPVVTCPDDLGVSGGGPACSDPVAVEYDLPMISDDCEARISQNTDETPNGALDCSGGQVTGHLRQFDLAASGIVNSFVLSKVEVGVSASSGSPIMTVNIYDLADIPNAITTYLPPMTSAGVEPLATTDFVVPDGNAFIVEVPIQAILDPNSTMVIEVISPDTIDFLIGYNDAGTGNPGNYTEVGFIACEGAAITYTDPADFGFDRLSTIIVPTGADLTITQTAGIASGDTFPAGDTINSFDVTDEAGNTASCSFTVTVGDFTAPDVTGPIDIFTGTGGPGGTCDAVINYDPVTATDNCTDDADITITLTEGLASGSAFPVGTTTVTYSVMDTAGNETLHTFDVTITDTSAPSIDCPDDFAVSPDATGNYTLPDWTTLASDACSSGADLVTTQDPAAGTVVADGSTTEVTITATDAAGNVTECVFNVTVDGTLGVNDLALSNALSIYPNPTANVFTLTNGSGASLETMTIVDVNGRIIDTISLTDMDTVKEISIAHYATGIYFARISTESASTVKRIVKR